jgi:hypothetical protein
MSGFTPSIQLRGFGGASFINGNTPPTAGFDGAADIGSLRSFPLL